MIIVCEKCRAKYSLNDGLIKKPVFKVCCSKCKHVFYVDTSIKEEVYDLQAIAAHHADEGMVIAICNQKGGVAKTSTCLNLGASLSLSGKRVLLVDFDPQSNLSLVLGKKHEASFHEIYTQEISVAKAIKTVGRNLWLLPANSKIALLAKQALKQNDFGFILRDVLQPVKQNFDYIFIDTPPSLKFFTPNALMAANFVIIPTQSEFLAMNGVLQMESIIQALAPTRRLNYRILITMYDEKNTASRVVYAKLREKYREKLFKAYISSDYKMQESQIVNEPVVSYDRQAQSTRQYLDLAKELEAIFN